MRLLKHTVFCTTFCTTLLISINKQSHHCIPLLSKLHQHHKGRGLLPLDKAVLVDHLVCDTFTNPADIKFDNLHVFQLWYWPSQPNQPNQAWKISLPSSYLSNLHQVGYLMKNGEHQMLRGMDSYLGVARYKTAERYLKPSKKIPDIFVTETCVDNAVSFA